LIQEKINIAIDGYSSCGKGTLAKAIARKLNYLFIDSGAMYRAVTYYFIKNQPDINNPTEIELAFKNIKITFNHSKEEDFFETILNGVSIEKEIREMEVSQMVSRVSKIDEVRTFLVAQQQEISKNKGVVMDGRDIGTVVLPNAELKLFMTANLEIRAERRYKELIQSGHKEISYEMVVANLKERDFIDSNRKNSPLKQSEEAIVIDNSDITKEAQLDLALSYVNQVLKN